MIFADAPTPNVNTVWIVIIMLASVGANIATILVAFRKKQDTEVSPQPLIVAMEKEFVAKKEFEDQKKHCTERHGQIFAKIEKIDKGIGAEIERQIEVVRKDVVAVDRNVSSLQTATAMQNQQLARLDTKLDRIIENKLT